MAISSQEVAHVASLAKLAFAPEELAKFTGQMDAIIKMVEQLQEVDTEGVKPTYHGNQLINVLREDKAIERNKTEELLKNAPLSEGGFIQVPAILESGEV